MVESSCLLSNWPGQLGPRVRIPASPPVEKCNFIIFYFGRKLRSLLKVIRLLDSINFPMFNLNYLGSFNTKNKGFIKNDKSFLIILSVLLFYYIFQFYSFRLGIDHEEGRDANAYLLAMGGNLPYRDFEWLYGPFSFFVYPMIMKIFGVNLVVLRISYIIFASLVIPLSFSLARMIMPPLWAGIASFLSIILFVIPYYTYNHIFLVLGSLTCLLLICKYLETNKKISTLISAGIFCSVALLTKPLVSGITVFVAIALFLLVYKQLSSFWKRFKDFLIFSIATVFLPFIYYLYFYFQTSFKGIAIAHPYFAKDSSLFTDLLPRVTNVLFLLRTRIASLLPIRQIINLSSFSEFKKILIVSFDSFISLLPFVVCGLLLFAFICLRSINERKEIKEKTLQSKKFLLLFGIFSIFISVESTMRTHIYNRAFTIQTPFIITVYLLYYLKTAY